MEKLCSKSDCEMEIPLKITSNNDRTFFTDDQLNALKQAFEENRYPNRKRFEELSRKIGVSFYSIRMWFRNRRKTKRDKKISSSTHKHHEKKSSGSDCESETKKSEEMLWSQFTKFTNEQRNMLLQVFKETQYPSTMTMEDLAKRMLVPLYSIRIWFVRNRKLAKKRKNKEKSSSTHDHKKMDFGPVNKSGKKNPLKIEKKWTQHKSNLTDDQQNELMRAFEENRLPDHKKKEELAQKTGLSILMVNRWFKYRRYLWRQTSAAVYDEKVGSKLDCKSETEKPEIKFRRIKKFTNGQKNELIRLFKENQYPKRNILEELAQRNGIPLYNIRVWFKNARRSKILNKPASPSTDNDDDV